MRAIFLGVLLCAAMVASFDASGQEAAESTRQQGKRHYLIEMSCAPNDRDAVAGTLRAALALREDKSEVTLFIDADAVHVAKPTSDAQANELQREFDNLFAKLRTAGVTVLVCPHCAEVHGLPAKSLRQGLRFTTKEELQAARDRADQIYEYRPKVPEQADEEKVAVKNRTT